MPPARVTLTYPHSLRSYTHCVNVLPDSELTITLEYMNDPAFATARHEPTDRPTPQQVDAVMLATRVLVAVSARSIAAVEDRVTLPQLRVLVMIASRGPLNLRTVAEGLAVHPSNTTRTCDRLIVAGLLSRRDNPADRRNLVLELTTGGRQLVDGVNRHRREAIEAVLTAMPRSSRDMLATALTDFAHAGGETDTETGAWALGWTTENPINSPIGRPESSTAADPDARGIPAVSTDR